MQQFRATTVADLVATAKASIENLDCESLRRELASGAALLVDLREPAERDRDGVIGGSVHAVRGMLEFYADASSPYHRPEFDPARRVILYCASGGRSALAAKTLQDFGYTDVAHLEGGFNAWRAQGLAIERPDSPLKHE